MGTGRQATGVRAQWRCRRLTEMCALRGYERFLISMPRLGVYYFFVVDSVCLSVCLSVTNIDSILFLDGIEPFFANQFSMTKTTKLFLRFLI